ncbi:interferon-induced protein 44-like [Engraulis encrasicolus]|uniref:interferon-induced protein 44-like n=1 Tax=Engraulis encrasicolus TaxID=184585 RepID=UPI002FD2BC14
MGGSKSKSVPVPVPSPFLPDHWRKIDFSTSNKTRLLEEIRNFDIVHPEVKQLRILVHGPVGAGKSSFISSIASIFKGRMVQAALVDTGSYNVGSFTKKFESIKLRDKGGKVLPFLICDIMGLEDDVSGARTEDLVIALEGHLKDGYMFNPVGSMAKNDPHYNRYPTLNDKIHCLVSILPGDGINMMDSADARTVIQKLREIREKASELKIPQVIIMTKADLACAEVYKDPKKIYKSKEIKKMMEVCTDKLGIPLNFVLPVKNYHEENALDDGMDILLLSALKSILNFANDHVESQLDD